MARAPSHSRKMFGPSRDDGLTSSCRLSQYDSDLATAIPQPTFSACDTQPVHDNLQTLVYILNDVANLSSNMFKHAGFVV